MNQDQKFQAIRIAVEITTIPVQKFLNKVCKQKYPGLKNAICPALEVPEIGMQSNENGYYQVYMDLVDDDYTGPDLLKNYNNIYIDHVIKDYVMSIRAVTYMGECSKLNNEQHKEFLKKCELVWNPDHLYLQLEHSEHLSYEGINLKPKLGVYVRKLQGSRKGTKIDKILNNVEEAPELQKQSMEFLSDLKDLVDDKIAANEINTNVN